MPKETASPGQPVEKAETWGLGNDMNVCAGKGTHPSVAKTERLWCFLKVKASGRKEGEKRWKQGQLELSVDLKPK